MQGYSKSCVPRSDSARHRVFHTRSRSSACTCSRNASTVRGTVPKSDSARSVQWKRPLWKSYSQLAKTAAVGSGPVSTRSLSDGFTGKTPLGWNAWAYRAPRNAPET